MKPTAQELRTFREKAVRVRVKYGMGQREAHLSIVRLLSAWSTIEQYPLYSYYLKALCHLAASVWDGTVEEFRLELTALVNEYLQEDEA